LKEKGFNISGSDLKESKITKELEKEGVEVKIPHHKDNILGKDLVIYSAAIKEENTCTLYTSAAANEEEK
ncbi:Mur ligase domain-containing protein, partial [Campylobacter jejuni]|uniref:Mur ligase domain-containing protein n=1 Tax=Campylobacter jejuni TaxID=197 RepID=UPI0020440243